jgi:hypothetical protein
MEDVSDASAVRAVVAVVGTTSAGACVFFDADNGRLCRVHRELGEPLLPSACRHFPRVSLRDARGLSITLSHFCPTAAGLLFAAVPLAVVDAPDSISLAGTAEGLDATAALPPLLRRDMLADIAGYDAWERAALTLLDRGGDDAAAALASLRAVTLRIREWSPGSEALRDRVIRLMARVDYRAVPVDPAADAQRYARVLASVPPDLTAPPVDTSDRTHVGTAAGVLRYFDAPVRRYLVAKLFGNWWPYLGLDLLGVVEALEVHASVLRIHLGHHLHHTGHPQQALLNAIRDTDLLMVHLSDSRRLAELIAASTATA